MVEWIKENKAYAAAISVFVILFILFSAKKIWEEPYMNGSQEWMETDVQGDEPNVLEEGEEFDGEILVDVKGEVRSPGVYPGERGDRVIDMIEKAGGLTEEADPQAINFAMRITDEMAIYIPAIGEETIGNLVMENAGVSGGTDGKVNINKASKEELETLSGIGPSKAQAIIEYREENGAFRTPEDLMSVSGIGEKTFEKLKDSITVR